MNFAISHKTILVVCYEDIAKLFIFKRLRGDSNPQPRFLENQTLPFELRRQIIIQVNRSP
jgi:hypothetical protein